MEILDTLLPFLAETELLKTVSRSNRTLDHGRAENSAEHSWQGALLALLLKDTIPYDVDMETVQSMLLLHDMGEIHAGDTLVFDEVGKADSHQREQVSLDQTFGLLPDQQKSLFFALWEEFETGETNEARYARVIDALVPLVSHLLVAPRNYNPLGITRQQVLDKKAFIQSESATLWDFVLKCVEQSVQKGLYR